MMNTEAAIPVLNLPILFDNLQLHQCDETTRVLIAQIDALLPQTQCGLCGYHDGCLPYAHAIATGNEATNLCVPGGDDTSFAIAKLINQPAAAAKKSKWAINPDTRRPMAMHAIIDESACIGCTKCLPACPVDAIIGSAKHMHSIIHELCTGCELCISPCPVDCIDIIPAKQPIKLTPSDLKKRYHAHLNRLSKQISSNQLTVASHTQSKIANSLSSTQGKPAPTDAKSTIAAAKLRSQIKKLSIQLSKAYDPHKEAERQALQKQLDLLN